MMNDTLPIVYGPAAECESLNCDEENEEYPGLAGEG